MEKRYPYVVVGLGVTGLACCRYLKRKGLDFAVVDSREDPPCKAAFQALDPDVQAVFGGLDVSLLLQADALLVSPGIDTRLPAFDAVREAGIPLLGDIDLFAQVVHRPVIGITGSNGKSTVTTLLGEMLGSAGLRVAVAGNIGVPVLDVVDDDVDYFILELSSFQLELTERLALSSAVVLNVSPDHLDRYNSYGDYAAVKRSIYRHCRHPVVNAEQEDAWKGAAQGDTVSFALNKKADFYLQRWNKQWFLMFREARLLPYKQLASALKPFPENVLAALALAYQVGSSLSDMIDVIKNFKGLPHRCQEVSRHAGVRWIDDSKATNIGSAIAAVERFSRDPGRLIVLLGGQGKGADFTSLGQTLDALAAHAVVMGEDAVPIAKHIHAAQVHRVGSMQEAVQRAADLARPEDTVLLAPACASFDMFAHFSDRGDQFQQAIKALATLP